VRLDFREKEERDVEIRAQSANARARIRDDGHEHRLTVDKEVSGNVHREKCGVYRQRRAASGEAPEATFVYQSRPNPESDRNGRTRSGSGQRTVAESGRDERERSRGGGFVRVRDVRVVLRRGDYRERWEFDRVLVCLLDRARRVMMMTTTTMMTSDGIALYYYYYYTKTSTAITTTTTKTTLQTTLLIVTVIHALLLFKTWRRLAGRNVRVRVESKIFFETIFVLFIRFQSVVVVYVVKIARVCFAAF
jgi:hypothetical protein